MESEELRSWTSGESAADVADEEAAVSWAALESSQNPDRQRTGIIYEPPAHYKYDDLDVAKMGPNDCRIFIDRILKTADEGNAAFLKKLRDRIDKVGIKLPTVEIKFEKIVVEAKCYVGSRAMPSLFNEIRNTAEEIICGLVCIRSSEMATLNILKDVSGIIRPSRMTLLLGPPSSGKTTLLRALAGKLDPALKMRGEITYNGYKQSEFVAGKTSTYISQNDVHTAEMTVKETLNFSSICQGLGDRYELLRDLMRREEATGIVPDPEVDLFMKATSMEGVQRDLQTDYTLRILGLVNCADTIVGNQMRRGISGGQRKRVTTGEIIVGPTKTLFMDEISTGLDSLTTHNMLKCLQHIVRLGEATMIMSLLQPAPETFDLFDDIILLAEGQIIYQGPREYALQFFQTCGFTCPEKKGIADFLQEVTSKKEQEQYWTDAGKPYRFVPATEFVECFNRFHVGKDLQNKLSVPFDKKKSHGAALVFTNRSAPLKQLLKASFKKEWLLIKRNSFIYISRIIQLSIMAIITSTVFPRMKLKTRNEGDGEIYLGAILYGMTVSLIYSISEQGIVIMRLPVFYKQRNLLFYPTWVFTFPHCMIRIPISIIESSIWVILTYYFIGFAPEASRFFKQLLLLFLVREVGAGMFRLVTGLTRSNAISSSFGIITLVIVMALSGYIVPKALLPKWWLWGYWLSPINYSFTALAINEMLSPRWMDKVATDGRRLGVAILENISVITDESWYWKSAAVLLGYVVLFNVLFTFSLAYLNPLGKPNPLISEEKTVGMKDKRSLSMDKGDKVVKIRSDYTSNGTPNWHSVNSYKEEAKNNTSRGGMALPFTPLTMSFKEVNYYVNMHLEKKEKGVTKERLQLLRGVTGSFRPGILTAIMGESGSGKTTLMDVLAGRKTSGCIEGDIKIDGYPKKQSTFTRISGYCEQFDVHSSQLTVMESVIFSALLRLDNELNKEEKYRFMNEVMELVELDNLKDAMVGISGINGLSMEQRKRLTIAIELVANPSIIFMDEPTSGLDARAAAIIMRSMRNIVDQGRTVVCTIHQPSISIFESFDELLLLKRGGQVIYSGPLGQNSQKLIDYFEAISGIKMKENCNPAVWMLEASSIATEARLGVDYADIYKSSLINKSNMTLVRQMSIPLPGTSDLCFPTKYPQSSLDQFKICLWKYRCVYWRNPEYNLSRFSITLIIALLLGCFYWKIGLRRDKSTDLISIIGILYIGVLSIAYVNRFTAQTFIASERSIFYREYGAGMYSAIPYSLSQLIVEIAYTFFQTLYYTLIVYSMMGFQWTTKKFMWFFIIIYLSFLGFTYLGMFLMAISRNLQASAILSGSIFLLFHLFSGFFIPMPRLPKWWIWIYWMCPTRWTLYGLIITQYSDMHELIKVSGQHDQQIRDFIFNHFGYQDGYNETIIIIIISFAMLFAILYSCCIRSLNFQHR